MIMIDLILGIITPFILLIAAGYLMLNYRDDNVMKWVTIAVKAAEQIYKESGKGKEKFEYVSKWITEKFKIPEEDLKNLIESAVFELNKDK